MINKEKIAQIFIERHADAEEMPDVEQIIMGILEDELGELIDELEDKWNDMRSEYLQEKRDEEDLRRFHAVGVI
jgi:hypothetical protein